VGESEEVPGVQDDGSQAGVDRGNQLGMGVPDPVAGTAAQTGRGGRKTGGSRHCGTEMTFSGWGKLGKLDNRHLRLQLLRVIAYNSDLI
jgi:hypothetical protein